ncbi:hypothetical protein QR680_014638 [Steinernema hermaphroditum]|uniref:MGAT4 conserved region domain-containing protein n=1 Tax=Steinernema hermaphroditum TaxID=289476 RepID=A0AA39I9N7_9BILA|nr:hypothetical protein QR680_014638 [Steinernema hermaphroditum]
MVRRGTSLRSTVLKVGTAVLLLYLVRKWTEYEVSSKYEQLLAVERATTFRSPMDISNGQEVAHLSKEPQNLVPFPLYDVLPHLIKLPADALLNPAYPLKPRLKRSGNSTSPKIVVAIPSVYRAEVNYLRTTLDSLFENLSPEEALISKFIVMLAEIDSDSDQKIDHVAEELKKYFEPQVESGLLEFIVPPLDWYPPNLANTTPTFGDSPERMYWRTKQNLDYAYLMLYASHFFSTSRYYVQLEDDISAAKGYISTMMQYADGKGTDWLSCEFSKLGFIGKLFHIYDLPLIYRFILMFHADKPVDWLLDQLFEVKYCHHEEKNCVKKRINNIKRNYARPPLFQHLGRFSSLKGKKQNLREAGFNRFRVAHDAIATTKSGNPGVSHTDSSTDHGSGSLTDPYTSSGNFSLQNPHVGDYFLYHFKFPCTVLKISLTMCLPTAKPPSVIVRKVARIVNRRRERAAEEEIMWTSTSSTAMEYSVDADKALKISELRFEINDDTTPFCMERIAIQAS